MQFAKWVYRTAGIYGLLVLAPLVFLERTVSQTSPPALTHPEYDYGFVITGVAWQVAFIVISGDPQRFRPLMPVTWLEKNLGGVHGHHAISTEPHLIAGAGTRADRSAAWGAFCVRLCRYNTNPSARYRWS